jgi:hypothetical protein
MRNNWLWVVTVRRRYTRRRRSEYLGVVPDHDILIYSPFFSITIHCLADGSAGRSSDQYIKVFVSVLIASTEPEDKQYVSSLLFTDPQLTMIIRAGTSPKSVFTLCSMATNKKSTLSTADSSCLAQATKQLVFGG